MTVSFNAWYGPLDDTHHSDLAKAQVAYNEINIEVSRMTKKTKRLVLAAQEQAWDGQT